MQPLDRGNAQVRRDAAAMLAATLHQRVENAEQRTRVLGEAGKPVPFTEREDEALGRASDGRVTWSLG